MVKKAVQQIMIGSVCKTEEKTISTLNSIRSAGYDSIELNGFMIKPTPFIVRLLTKVAGMPTGSAGKFDWKTLINESGLKVCSIHEDLGSIERDIDSIIKEAQTFNTNNVVVTGMYRFAYNDKNEVKSLAQRLNKAGEELKKNGINLLYHNHNIEFVRFDNQQGEYLQNCPYSLLINETNEDFVNFEFDSYWACDAGINPLDIMKILSNRMRCYHITDRGSRLSAAALTPIIKNDSMELGYGNMNIASLIETAKSCNTEAIILESHKNWIDKNPVKSLELSAKYLNAKI
ncbi:MAG: sugar phosphate isomerase/epimerase [Eubacterium sp.]|nr:sugar phosphate isomerase/epimerase [Eubacterium sp.]